MMAAKDSRVALMGSLLRHMSLVKALDWEEVLTKKVSLSFMAAGVNFGSWGGLTVRRLQFRQGRVVGGKVWSFTPRPSRKRRPCWGPERRGPERRLSGRGEVGETGEGARDTGEPQKKCRSRKGRTGAANTPSGGRRRSRRAGVAGGIGPGVCVAVVAASAHADTVPPFT